MSKSFLENNWVVHVAPTAVIAGADNFYEGTGAASAIVTDVMSLENADGAVYIMPTLTNASANVSVYMYAASNSVATTTAAISFRYSAISAPDTIYASGETKEYLTSTTGDIVYVFEVDAAKVAEQGYTHVQMVTADVADHEADGAIIGFLTGLRYKEDDIGTQVDD
jgi:hypothetical protein